MILLANANAKRIPLANKSVDMLFTSVPFKDEDVGGDYWTNYHDWHEEMRRVARKVYVIINSVNRLEGVIDWRSPDRILAWGKGVNQCAYRWNPIFVYGIDGYKVNKYIWCDAFGVESVTGKWKVHHYQDPVLLYKTIIGMFNDCQTVLDPFMGSGTAGVACQLLGRDFIGLDIDPYHIEIAKQRTNGYVPVAEGVKQLTIDVPAMAESEEG